MAALGEYGENLRFSAADEERAQRHLEKYAQLNSFVVDLEASRLESRRR